jgi:hypothetical protein
LNVAFVGTVTELYPVLEPGIEPGGDSYGSFQIDTAAVDSNPQAHRGRYPDPSDIQSLTVTLPEPSGGMLSLCGAGLLLLTRRARRRRTRGNARSRPS